MRRSWPAWLTFGFCVALAAAAIARVGNTALELERAEARARRQADLEEKLQLALCAWIGAGTPDRRGNRPALLLLQPPLSGGAAAFTNMFAEIQRGDVLVPSPLLTFSRPRSGSTFNMVPMADWAHPRSPPVTCETWPRPATCPRNASSWPGEARGARQTGQPQGTRIDVVGSTSRLNRTTPIPCWHSVRNYSPGAPTNT